MRPRLERLREQTNGYTVTPAQYLRVAYVALGALTLIVLTGAAVRLTGSGLGCPTWPKCYGNVYPPLNTHAVIEFSNRLITVPVSIAAGSQTPPAVGVAPDGSWWAIGVTSSGREAVSVSTDQGAKWSTASGAGLPVGADGSVLPVSGTEAWVTVTVTVESSASLFVTVDAGAHWLPVVPEALP